MNDLLTLLGVICLYAFGCFMTVGLWLIGAASFLKWLGLIA
ncbi:hypothetical protein [Paracoccus siganidrum]|nr:hypothetical protein [Paracoccus siganidrum]